MAFDSGGEAYLFCLAFNRGTPTSDSGLPASGLFLFRSADGGASWNFPGSPVKQSPGDGSDNIGLLDKPYMAADTGKGSRFRDRLYVAWAEYNVDFSADPIGFAWSDDHGATWNLVPAISGTSAELCPVNFDGSPAGTCNANQFPQPFTAPNGDLYVVFQNFNNAVGAGGDNHNQILIVKSTDGGQSFSAPVKVSDFNDLPDCLTYTGHDAGRACVPTAPLSDRSIFRATNYPSAVATSNNRIVVTLASYLNRHSNPERGNCTPAGFSTTTGLNLYTGVGERNGCNNDIVVSVSTDAGASFTGTTTPVAELPSVSDENPRTQLADQWWQWAALNPKGGVTVAYYDRKYGDAQQTGFMDITMRRGNGNHVRVTNRSLPPTQEFPEAGASTGVFVGDYMGVAVGSDGIAHPIWTDTRNPVFSPSTGGDVRELVRAGQGTDIYARSLPG
ncbi:MAG TPA: sialidase family protein [Actinomycetes bacterium]|nr:sialidase family protein [Actinomycetes bacterium]